jgi:hypothetical protein
MSFPFCVDSSLTGADAYLIVGDGRLKWREEIPEGMWTLSLETRSENCLRTLLELDARLPELSVPQKYVTSMKEAMGENFSYGEVPWRHVLPPSEYKRFLTGMVKNVQRALDGIDTTYYTETFSRVSGLFESLDYPAIDVPRLEAYLKDPKTVNTHTLASFKPVAGSFARKARYERVGTRTGRLKMKSGPDMLTLKKDYRNVVTTRHAANEGIDWIILTNGRTFQFYRVLFGKPISVELLVSLDFVDATPKMMKDFANILVLFTKKAVVNDEHELFWQRSIALSPANISKLLYSEEVVKLMRRELKKTSSINFEPEAIKDALRVCLGKAVNTESMRFKTTKAHIHEAKQKEV